MRRIMVAFASFLACITLVLPIYADNMEIPTGSTLVPSTVYYYGEEDGKVSVSTSPNAGVIPTRRTVYPYPKSGMYIDTSNTATQTQCYFIVGLASDNIPSTGHLYGSFKMISSPGGGSTFVWAGASAVSVNNLIFYDTTAVTDGVAVWYNRFGSPVSFTQSFEGLTIYYKSNSEEKSFTISFDVDLEILKGDGYFFTVGVNSFTTGLFAYIQSPDYFLYSDKDVVNWGEYFEGVYERLDENNEKLEEIGGKLDGIQDSLDNQIQEEIDKATDVGNLNKNKGEEEFAKLPDISSSLQTILSNLGDVCTTTATIKSIPLPDGNVNLLGHDIDIFAGQNSIDLSFMLDEPTLQPIIQICKGISVLSCLAVAVYWGFRVKEAITSADEIILPEIPFLPGGGK